MVVVDDTALMKAKIKHRTDRLRAEAESGRVAKLGHRLWFAGFVVVAALTGALDTGDMSRQQLWALFTVLVAAAAGLHYALRGLICSKLRLYKQQEYRSWCELRELRASEHAMCCGHKRTETIANAPYIATRATNYGHLNRRAATLPDPGARPVKYRTRDGGLIYRCKSLFRRHIHTALD